MSAHGLLVILPVKLRDMVTETKPSIGVRIQLPVHFDAPVILEDVWSLSDGYECRARLADGSHAVVLFSRGEAPSEISVAWEEIGHPNHVRTAVRDLWAENIPANSKVNSPPKLHRTLWSSSKQLPEPFTK